MYRNYPDLFDLTGADPSALAAEFYQKNIDKTLLPADSFLPAGVEELSLYPELLGHYDVLHSHYLLHYIPYVKESRNLGLGKYLEQFSALLRLGGMAQITLRAHYPNQFLPIYTMDYHQILPHIAQHSRLRIQQQKETHFTQNNMPGTAIGEGFEDLCIFNLVKY